MYQIKAFYQTGDSFHTEENLNRIREHYRWYENKERAHWMNDKEIPEPEWHKGIKYVFCIKLKLDNGNEVQFSAPWCGYFERLYGAKIINAELKSFYI